MDQPTPASILYHESESERRRKSGSSRTAKVRLSTSRLRFRLFRGAGPNKRSSALYRGGRRGRNWGQRPGRSVSTHAAKCNVVAKAAWVNNGGRAKARLSAALGYNQNRDRGVWEKERLFFTRDKDGLDKSDIHKEIESKFGKDIAFHTVILSPGDNTVDIKHFVRETVRDWEKDLGYQIDYYAVVHYNTDHYHAHLIVPGSSIDKDYDVRFDRMDLADLREAGNDYLARERNLDRALDRAIEREFELSLEERFDHQVQKEFGLDLERYERDQESLGLSTSKDMYKERQELGLTQFYEPGRPFARSSPSGPTSSEGQDKVELSDEPAKESEFEDFDPDSDLTDYFYLDADASFDSAERDLESNDSAGTHKSVEDESPAEDNNERDDHERG